MGDDRQILCFTVKLLMWIHARSEHLRSGPGSRLTHLLLHLTGRYRKLEDHPLEPDRTGSYHYRSQADS
jgi:hypothetical protein